MAAAAAAINKAKRPVMLVGGGVINANAEYDAMHLCEKLRIPVVSTLMGLGAISAYRQLFLGMTGLHGHERANNAVKEADLILAVALMTALQANAAATVPTSLLSILILTLPRWIKILIRV